MKNNVSMILIREANGQLVQSAFITCEVGVDSQCRKNQECVRPDSPDNNSKSRNGVCHCKIGYDMTNDGNCVTSKLGDSGKG